MMPPSLPLSRAPPDGKQREGLTHGRCQAHDAGRVPALRPCDHRADRPLHGRGRALPGAQPSGARIGPRAPAGGCARAGRALRGRSARCRRDHRSRPHALAVPQLLCVLPGQCLRPLDPRRSALLRVRGAGHALGDEPRLHRARDPRARLAGRPARAAGGLPLEHGRRRRHSGQRVEQHADRAHRRARARERRRDQ